MASLKFYATTFNASNPGGILITHGLGSGLGFYGAGYGVSVPIAGRQDTTWLTNSDGTSSERIQLNNTKYVSSNTVSINGATAVNLDRLPNDKCPLNIRFEHDSAVRVQNCKLRIFDRNNINNQASGVVTYVYEARHPSSNQAVSNLSQRAIDDANSWYEFDPIEAMTDMPLTPSPGISGVNTNSTDTDPVLGYLSQQGVSHASVRHDWYGAISAEPDSIGSKINYALYVSCEYL
jgi:hypothetical protein